MNFNFEDIINDEIISPLEKCMNDEISADSVNWNAIRYIARSFKFMGCEDEYHIAMHPFYLKYIYNINAFKDKNEMWQFVNQEIREYDGLADWIGQMDIIQIVEEMAHYNTKHERLFTILDLLLKKGYRPYIKKWPRSRIEEEIEKLEKVGNRNIGVLYCILLAYHMIESTSLTDERKDELESLLETNWRFLLNVYSVMVRRIIGSGFKVFSQLANNVNIMADCYPHIHIFYNAILLRQDDLFPTDKDKDKLVKHMTRMEDIMKDTPQSIELDELCNIIFGEEFESVMQRKRFKSYDELNTQVKQLENTVGKLNKMIEVTVMRLKEAVESSVPINVIETQLLRLDGQTAWFIFSQLNTLLLSQDNWIAHSKSISDKILEKKNNEAKIINAEHYYDKGSVHEDKSHQMKITGNSPTTPLLNNKQ